jgi:hypothetical protein
MTTPVDSFTLECHVNGRCYDGDGGKLQPVDGVKYGRVTIPVHDGYDDVDTVDWWCPICGKVWRERSRLYAVEHVGDRDLGSSRDPPGAERECMRYEAGP